jgi:CRP-like cAMP-binding protein
MLMHAKIDNFLSQLPFLTPEADTEEHEGLGMLSSVCKYEAFNAGEPIFFEGDKGDKLYIILKGECAVLKNDTANDAPEPSPEDELSESEGRAGGDLPGAVPAARNSDPSGDANRRRGSVTKMMSSSKISDPNASKSGTNKGNAAAPGKGSMMSRIKNRLKKKETGAAFSLEADDVLAKLGSGNYFGEMAVMVTMPRSSTIVATERSLLLTVSKEEWKEFLEHHDATRVAVEMHMKSRLMGMFAAMNISFFENVTKNRFAELAPDCDVLDLANNSTVMKQGDRGDTFYVIINGRVSVDVKKGVGGADAPKFDFKGELCSGAYVRGWGGGRERGGERAQQHILRANPPARRYFGEIALVMDVPRKATVTTMEETVLLGIKQLTFNKFFEGNPRALAEIQIRLLGDRADLHSVRPI